MSRQKPNKSRQPRHSDERPQREGRGGGNSGAYWLYGTHAVLAAIANPERKCRKLLITREAAGHLEDELARLGHKNLHTVERPDIERVLPPGAVHQGIALQVEPLEMLDVSEIPALAEGRSPAVVIALDQVTDPHNVGAITRSAAAFGAVALLIPDRHAPDETGTLAKSASGALERLPVVRVINLARALDDLKAEGFWVAGLAADAPSTLAEAKLSGKIVLVLGSEGEGLRRLTREKCDLLVKLPMTGAVESLNVSNAAAVALYECIRQG